jgi:ABC-type sugar transport system substrate-binding protein
VKVVALDDLPEQLEQIQRGLVDSTAATKPHAQGYWAVMNLWQHHLGAPAIERIDTGIRIHKGVASP